MYGAGSQCCNLIQLSYNGTPIAHSASMSTEKPILEHSVEKCQRASERVQDAEASSRQERATRRMWTVVAGVDTKLRASSTEANELIKRSTVIVCRSTEMIRNSREVIARSRRVLDGAYEPVAENRQPKRR